MGTSRSTFAKLDRDRNKKAKAAAKRERRQGKAPKRADEIDDDGLDDTPLGEPGEELSAPELLAQVERIHRQLDDGEIDFDEFEERKTDLMSRIPVD